MNAKGLHNHSYKTYHERDKIHVCNEYPSKTLQIELYELFGNDLYLHHL